MPDKKDGEASIGEMKMNIKMSIHVNQWKLKSILVIKYLSFDETYPKNKNYISSMTPEKIQICL